VSLKQLGGGGKKSKNEAGAMKPAEGAKVVEKNCLGRRRREKKKGNRNYD
jgi:hypothetical protein